jgi:hypothetical protein
MTAFTTHRLEVHRTELTPEYVSYLASPKDGTPCIVAVADVVECANDLECKAATWHCRYLATISNYQRQGFARELWRGLETYSGRRLVADPTTEQGKCS